ncbi:MAG: ABC transporter ATP-binding protein, partial [Alphaproteobacteria bacterium]|nr:ABC transporter ATP-binding protein [Alphaproteobacteria bacterium]
MKRFLPYFALLKPVRWAFVGALLSGLVFGVASGFGLPFVAQKVFPVLFGGQEVDQMTLWGYLMILPMAFALRGISGFLNTYLIAVCGTAVLNQLRARVFAKLQQMPLLAYQKHPTGDLLTRANSDTAQLQNTLMSVSNDLVKYPITLLGAVAAVIYLAAMQHQLQLILILLGVIPLCVIPIRFLGMHLQKRAKQSQAQNANVTDILNENIRGVREVKLYAQEAFQASRFRQAIDQLRRFALKMVKYSASLNPIIEFISVIGITVAIYFAYRAHLTLEVVAPLIMALYMAYEPVKKIGGVHNSLKQGGASLERIEQLLNEPNDMQEPAEAIPMNNRARGQVTFEKVSFSYPRGERRVLDDFSLQIQPGEVVGVVGPSGAGKTTLLGLLPRLFDPQKGAVKIDGIDVRQLKMTDLRLQLAAV